MHKMRRNKTELNVTTISVAKATLVSLMSSEGVVILNLGCGYTENGVVILSVINS